jgi:hypothetical protein
MRIFSQREATHKHTAWDGRQEFLIGARRPAQLIGNSVPTATAVHAEPGELDVAVHLTVGRPTPQLHASTLLVYIPLRRLII